MDESSFNLDDYGGVDSLGIKVELEFKDGDTINVEKNFNFNKFPRVVSEKYIRLPSRLHQDILDGKLSLPKFNYYVDNDNNLKPSEGDKLYIFYTKEFFPKNIDVEGRQSYPRFFDKDHSQNFKQ